MRRMRTVGRACRARFFGLTSGAVPAVFWVGVAVAVAVAGQLPREFRINPSLGSWVKSPVSHHCNLVCDVLKFAVVGRVVGPGEVTADRAPFFAGQSWGVLRDVQRVAVVRFAERGLGQFLRNLLSTVLLYLVRSRLVVVGIV